MSSVNFHFIIQDERDEFDVRNLRKLVKYVRDACPVVSGKMKSSIKLVGNTLIIGVDYASYVIFGTTNQQPNNFVGNALAGRKIGKFKVSVVGTSIYVGLGRFGTPRVGNKGKRGNRGRR